MHMLVFILLNSLRNAIHATLRDLMQSTNCEFGATWETCSKTSRLGFTPCLVGQTSENCL